MKTAAATFLAMAVATTASVSLLSQIPGDDRQDRTQDELRAIQDDADVNRKPIHDVQVSQLLSHGRSNLRLLGRTCDEDRVEKFQITQTTKGLPVYGYKLSKEGNSGKALYFQAMQHAREWVAGSSTLYALSSFLDDVANDQPTPLDNYNLYFVPVVNRDGYQKTWSGKRYQRKNGNEVDLNRNWPNTNPNPRPESPTSETYPGPYKLSENETQGIDTWLSSKSDEIDGSIDVHTYAGLILYAYGDTDEASPDEAKFDTLGEAMKAVMGNYVQEPAWKLYFAYGVYPDYAYRTFGKPSITIEMVGTDFVAPASTIRSRGEELKKGLVEFANQVPSFVGSDEPTDDDQPTDDEPSDDVFVGRIV
ncbi:Aste57867_422 [Aphanomyces stellatus]|uniref:Aste57867_422 protein n=1 Tax=Aphanomyces stellatus TaxID=120398 RepID=A0A485K3R8_9STRA|nr:hypothetical protein As57867_000421 [Aphanomyces stellatus]VFT77647.1 Aste57867_422 [Aphanomyces stellatus]